MKTLPQVQGEYARQVQHLMYISCSETSAWPMTVKKRTKRTKEPILAQETKPEHINAM